MILHQLVVIVAEVHHRGQANLLALSDARRLLRGFLGLGKNGEKDSCKDGDDCDHYEQFDQSKGFSKHSIT